MEESKPPTTPPLSPKIDSLIEKDRSKNTNQRIVLIILLVLFVLFAIVLIVYWPITPSSTHTNSNSNANTSQNNPTTQSVSASSIKGAALGIDTPVINDSKAISQIGRTPAIIDDFVGWVSGGGPNPFPKDFVDSIIRLNAMPMITWQPNQNITKDNSASVLSIISSGAEDSYIRTWADSAKAENHSIYLRLMHEMNGGWYPWGYKVNGNTPSMYVEAFQHVVKIFQQEGASNVQFIWCVSTSTANGTSNKVDSNIASYFPGDSYVAWVGMDGYSRIPSAPKSFSDIFNSTYSTITNISHRPVIIPETATVENPSDSSTKANWITTSFLTTVPNNFPRIKAILYFDSIGNGYTFPIDTSPTTLAAIQKVFANSYYQTPAPTSILSY